MVCQDSARATEDAGWLSYNQLAFDYTCRGVLSWLGRRLEVASPTKLPNEQESPIPVYDSVYIELSIIQCPVIQDLNVLPSFGAPRDSLYRIPAMGGEANCFGVSDGLVFPPQVSYTDTNSPLTFMHTGKKAFCALLLHAPNRRSQERRWCALGMAAFPPSTYLICLAFFCFRKSTAPLAHIRLISKSEPTANHPVHYLPGPSMRRAVCLVFTVWFCYIIGNWLAMRRGEQMYVMCVVGWAHKGRILFGLPSFPTTHPQKASPNRQT